jgi:DNA-directed RNA polymerase subunit omega
VERPFPIEDLVDRIGNRYAIVVAVAKRARQLNAGAKPLVDIDSKNPTTIALHEISAGLVTIEKAQPESADKPTPVTEMHPAELLTVAFSELDEDQDEDEQQDPDSAASEAEVETDDEAEEQVADEDGLTEGHEQESEPTETE